MRGLAPHSPDFVHGNENRRARHIVGRFEADADRGGIRPHTLSAMRLLFWQLTNRSLARPLVAVAVVLVEIGMSLQENLREICPFIPAVGAQGRVKARVGRHSRLRRRQLSHASCGAHCCPRRRSAQRFLKARAPLSPQLSGSRASIFPCHAKMDALFIKLDVSQ